MNKEKQSAWLGDMWELRSKLLGDSPHLSKEVLMTASDKTDVLPESVLFEILSANPDELKKEELISYLENKAQPLPGYMIDILRQVANGITYKTILKREMADYFAAKTQAANKIIRSVLADTIMNLQLYRNWLDNSGGLEADKQIIRSYIHDDDFTNAQALLNLLPALYNSEGEILTEFNAYKALTEFEINIKQQDGDLLQLDSMGIQFLVNIAENTNGNTRFAVRELLNFGYNFNYCNCPTTNDSIGLKNSINIENFRSGNSELVINAEPNPANAWVSFNYSIPFSIDEAVLTIKDIRGTEVACFYLDTTIGQKVWDIRNVQRGLYFYTLKTSNIFKSGKLIIN